MVDVHQYQRKGRLTLAANGVYAIKRTTVEQVGQRVEPSVHRNHARVDHARVGRVDADASRRSPGQLARGTRRLQNSFSNANARI